MKSEGAGVSAAREVFAPSVSINQVKYIFLPENFWMQCSFGLQVTDTIVIAENPNEDGEWGGTGSLMKEDWLPLSILLSTNQDGGGFDRIDMILKQMFLSI